MNIEIELNIDGNICYVYNYIGDSIPDICAIFECLDYMKRYAMKQYTIVDFHEDGNIYDTTT